MTKIIVVNKNKNKKETNVRDFSLENLFKRANLKNNINFIKRHTWKVNDKYVSLFAKNSGRANNENSYELPPPIDSQLYFGKLILVKHFNEAINDDNVEDLTLEEWEKIYEKLFGGFEDLGEEDSFSEDEIIPEKYKTKEGYSKEDGFIVDSDEEEDEEYMPEEEEYDSNSENSDDEIEELNSDELGSEGMNSDNLNEEDSGEDSENQEEYESMPDSSEEESDIDIGSELSEESYISDSDEE
jgi:hypothetical protein